MKLNEFPNKNRFQILDFISKDELIGIELGIAEGIFCSEMIMSDRFRRYYGVDRYSDHHNIKEYLSVIKNISIPHQKFTLVRASFDEAIELFPDEFFDFIYVDGYAHTGENGGRTISDWYPKLKVGGLMAGDDYHEDWPLVKLVVDHIAQKLDVELNVTTLTSQEKYCMYPSWAFKKKNRDILEIDDEIIEYCISNEGQNARKDLLRLKKWTEENNGNG